jgi:hypothetical protein
MGRCTDRRGRTPPDDLRLSAREAAHFLTVAWQTASEVLPASIDADPTSLRWADPPTVELHLAAEGHKDSTQERQPSLDDYINTSVFGSGPSELRDLLVAITAAPRLTRDDREDLTRRALTYSAQKHGFIDVTEAIFESGRQGQS